MINEEYAKKIYDMEREQYSVEAVAGKAHDLGPLSLLPGVWSNLPEHPKGLPGRGWNMIALPFASEDAGFRGNYRLLVNQYNEELKFTFVDKAVPNRGISPGTPTIDTDQFLVALDYQQTIVQINSADFPKSGKAGDPGLPIHHEPGLWLHMTNEQTNRLNIARLGTIPHGDSVLALGRSSETEESITIPDIDALPIGVNQNLERNPYLAPYKHFHDNLFLGVFDPTEPTALLKVAQGQLDIERTTVLEVDSEIDSGGIVNIPFIVKQANAASMKSTIWIHELKEKDSYGKPKLCLQYAQVVILDFFKRFDGQPGLIRWPHVSINTMFREDQH